MNTTNNPKTDGTVLTNDIEAPPAGLAFAEEREHLVGVQAEVGLVVVGVRLTPVAVTASSCSRSRTRGGSQESGQLRRAASAIS
ncbi:hypothetical protein, partial [Streptomyces cinereoruber]|uniref:hypothetical protein n=1 Tax=Streptomyces cinereoruber TaxID=67260 RepID=UPI0036401269